MDWAYFQEVGNPLIIDDAGCGWIEAFICSDGLTEKSYIDFRPLLGDSGSCTFYSSTMQKNLSLTKLSRGQRLKATPS